MPPQPLLTSISPASGKGGDGFVILSKNSEGSSGKINLELGIGGCGCVYDELKENEKFEQEKEEFLLTSAQIHEFHNQILVYNLIAFGLPVPFHLFVPIWMSVKAFDGPAIYKKYSSFVGFSVQNSDYSKTMDPEWERCRRTDGRKWRCSRNAVPNQKYCERHMHRGRQGSRKHVEPSEYVLKPDNITSFSDSSKMPATTMVSPVQSHILHHDVPCLNRPNDVAVIVKRGTNNNNRDSLSTIQSTLNACCRNIEFDGKINGNINVDVNHASGSTCTNSLHDGTMNVRCHTEGMAAGFRKINCRKRPVYQNNYLGVTSPGFGLSPKSALQCGAGKVSLELGGNHATTAEQQRCRRTDGKRWQCSRDAIPDQKYCEVHMHRGSKRLVINPELFTVAPSTSTTLTRIGLASHSVPKSFDSRINLNTMPASPQQTIDNNSTSSTSDATTITDENVSLRFTKSIHNC